MALPTRRISTGLISFLLPDNAVIKHISTSLTTGSVATFHAAGIDYQVPPLKKAYAIQARGYGGIDIWETPNADSLVGGIDKKNPIPSDESIWYGIIVMEFAAGKYITGKNNGGTTKPMELIIVELDE